MYISEIAPLNLRGGLGTVNQLGVTVGILFSQILGIQEILGTESGWPLLLGKNSWFMTRSREQPLEVATLHPPRVFSLQNEKSLIFDSFFYGHFCLQV